MSSEQQQREQDDHGKSDVQIVVDEHTFSIHRGSRPVALIKQTAGVPQTHVLEQVVDGKLVPLDDGGSVVLKGGERFISHLRDSASA